MTMDRGTWWSFSLGHPEVAGQGIKGQIDRQSVPSLALLSFSLSSTLARSFILNNISIRSLYIFHFIFSAQSSVLSPALYRRHPSAFFIFILHILFTLRITLGHTIFNQFPPQLSQLLSVLQRLYHPVSHSITLIRNMPHLALSSSQFYNQLQIPYLLFLYCRVSHNTKLRLSLHSYINHYSKYLVHLRFISSLQKLTRFHFQTFLYVVLTFHKNVYGICLR